MEVLFLLFLYLELRGMTATLQANRSKYSRLSLSDDFIVKIMVRFYHDNSGVYAQYNYISYNGINSYVDITYKRFLERI